MSDTGVHLLLAAVAGLCVLGVLALPLLGYFVARAQFRTDLRTSAYVQWSLRGKVHYLIDVVAEHCPEHVQERVANELAARGAAGRHAAPKEARNA